MLDRGAAVQRGWRGDLVQCPGPRQTLRNCGGNIGPLFSSSPYRRRDGQMPDVAEEMRPMIKLIAAAAALLSVGTLTLAPRAADAGVVGGPKVAHDTVLEG